MMRFDELIAATEALHREELQRWVDEAWVSALREGGTLHFSDMECARVRLICTLRYEYEVGEDALPIILSLLDQLYESRHRLNALATAVAGQGDDVRNAILRAVALRERPGSDDDPTMGAG